MTAPLSGRVAVLTGATRGIGLATARRLLLDGAAVVLQGRDASLLAARAAELGTPERVRVEPGDTTSADDLERLVGRAIADFGRLDILVAGAGVTGAIGVPVGALAQADWEDVIDVNLTGAFLACRAAVPHLIASPCGRIVTLGSTSGLQGEVGRAGYVASKWGLRGLMRTLARELAPHGVTANCVCPNFTRGERTLRIADETAALEGTEAEAVIAAIAAEMPLGRVLDEDDTASAIAWLVSDAGRNITGIEVPIEGGLLA